MALDYWDKTYAQYCFQYLTEALGGNEIGAAGILGNTYAESRICPFRCEGLNFEASRTETDSVYKTFSNAHDFARHYTYYNPVTGYKGYGYSLSQWTTFSRKEAYWSYVGGSIGIGDSLKSLAFLAYEMRTGYSGVWNVCVNATTIYEASTKVLLDYEAPADTSTAVRFQRASYATQIYNDFSGLPPIPPPTPSSGLPIWLLKMISDNEI